MGPDTEATRRLGRWPATLRLPAYQCPPAHNRGSEMEAIRDRAYYERQLETAMLGWCACTGACQGVAARCPVANGAERLRSMNREDALAEIKEREDAIDASFQRIMEARNEKARQP